MIVICAYYLCQNCITDQVAKPVELTTAVEKPGLAPHSSQWLFLPSYNSIFLLHFIYFPTTTHSYSDIHIWLLVTTQSWRRRRKTCVATLRGDRTRNVSTGNRLHPPPTHTHLGPWTPIAVGIPPPPSSSASTGIQIAHHTIALLKRCLYSRKAIVISSRFPCQCLWWVPSS